MNNPFNMANVDPKVIKQYEAINLYDLANKRLQELVNAGLYDGYVLAFYEPINGVDEPWELRIKESE